MLSTCFNIRPFGSVHPILVIRARASPYDYLSCVTVCAHTSMHARNFSRNFQAHASVHAHPLSRNIREDASSGILGRASVSIPDLTYMCLFVRAHSSASICDCGECSACLSVIMSNKSCLHNRLINFP